MKNETYMRRAIELAKRGEGLVNPNPMVGCVVVKDGRIIAEGWHERYGGFHAERNALLSCTEDTTGAELYVTLEPCCHTGKTPPCTEIIIERGISAVYIGSDDPNPLVAGHGIEILKNAGIAVETHVLKDECDALNEIFFHYITTKRPFVAMKYAMTLDGKIAMAAGRETAGTGEDSEHTSEELPSQNSRLRITGPEANAHVHGLRKRYRAILVGVGTVLADDPMLNVRLGDSAAHPIRIILDSNLRTPLTTQVVKTAKEIPTIIAHTTTEVEAYKNAGVILWQLPADSDGHVDLKALFEKMGEEGIDSVLVEGGSAIHGSLLAHPELIDRVYAYISPKLIGGSEALTPVGGAGITEENGAIRLTDKEIIPLGEDVLVTGRVSSDHQK